jgi:glycosyltransferase involved in cell wall biosynthesis
MNKYRQSAAIRLGGEGYGAGRKGRHTSRQAPPADERAPARVAILLATFHGQKYLADQLDSIAAQTYSNWVVWASDDGSNDDTRHILEAYRAKWGSDRLSIHSGPSEGIAANFLSMICQVQVQAGYFAYSDQDDIWEACKLQRAVAWLANLPPNTPGLYCSRTRLVDAGNRPIGYSPLFAKAPGFANALVQSIGGGNTMVLNRAARALMRGAGQGVDVVAHDWWTYMLVSGSGGNVFYDAYPSVRYRQHDGNVVGMNSGWKARLTRLRMLLAGRFKNWTDRNVRAMQNVRFLLTPENQKILDGFAYARHQPLLARLAGMKRSGLYRQTVAGTLALWMAAVIKKL